MASPSYHRLACTLLGWRYPKCHVFSMKNHRMLHHMWRIRIDSNSLGLLSTNVGTALESIHPFASSIPPRRYTTAVPSCCLCRCCVFIYRAREVGPQGLKSQDPSASSGFHKYLPGLVVGWECRMCWNIPTPYKIRRDRVRIKPPNHQFVMHDHMVHSPEDETDARLCWYAQVLGWCRAIVFTTHPDARVGP